jgi:hypothetical protein
LPDQNQILSSLQKYKNKYKDQYGIEDIGIFGSYARNTANENLVQLRDKMNHYLKKHIEEEAISA